MRNQPVPPNQPHRHNSYENVHNSRVAYYGWLTAYSGDLFRKKAVRLPPGMPAIGTFRLNTPNYEKESLTEMEYGQKFLYTSLVLD
jgi:hypothetical protein